MQWFEKGVSRLVAKGGEYYRLEEKVNGKWVGAGMVGTEDFFGGLSEQEKQWARANAR
jgi:hypothetical protein